MSDEKPWKAHTDMLGHVILEGGRIVAQVRKAEDMRRIVLAVNEHEALVGMVRRVVTAEAAFVRGALRAGEIREESDICRDARALLARIEKGAGR